MPLYQFAYEQWLAHWPGILAFVGVAVLLLWVCGLLRLAFLHRMDRERPTDDSQFRHILALLASTRLVIAIGQATRT
jgi:hypothetical protein